MRPRRHVAGTGTLLPIVAMVALFASVAWPLATYTLTLAVFGLPHVLSELRYVDLRFGRRLGRSLRLGLVVVLGVIASARLASLAGWLDPAVQMTTELGCGVLLVVLIFPTAARSGRAGGLSTIATALVLGTIILVSPIYGLLAIAVLHNFTPLGFLLEATKGPERYRAAKWGIVTFGVVPALIALGVVWAILSPAEVAAPEASPIGYGPLSEAMRAYLPTAELDATTALHAFSACVFLQCMHYICVLGVMPRMVHPGDGWLRWPSPRRWSWILVGAALPVVAYAFHFSATREVYGVLAAVHAWLELPILLLALGGLSPNPRR